VDPESAIIKYQSAETPLARRLQIRLVPIIFLLWLLACRAFATATLLQTKPPFACVPITVDNLTGV
jgi:hypothetical protein